MIENTINIFCAQGVIHELNKNYEVMKLVTNSLVKCHKQALSMVGESSHLTPNTLVDGRYSHLDVSSDSKDVTFLE